MHLFVYHMNRQWLWVVCMSMHTLYLRVYIVYGVCICTCMCVYIHMYGCVCVYMYMYVCIYIHMYGVCMCMCVCVCVCFMYFVSAVSGVSPKSLAKSLSVQCARLHYQFRTQSIPTSHVSPCLVDHMTSTWFSNSARHSDQVPATICHKPGGIKGECLVGLCDGEGQQCVRSTVVGFGLQTPEVHELLKLASQIGDRGKLA